MKCILTVLMFLALAVAAYGQIVQRDSVEMRGKHYYRDGHRLSMRSLMNQVRFDPEATLIMDKAKVNYQASTALTVLGIAAPFYPLGQLVRGDEPNWLVAVAGGLAIGLGVHLSNAKHRRIAESIQVYHRNLAAGNPSGSTQELGLRLRL